MAELDSRDALDAAAAQVVFTGTGKEFSRIVWRGGLLQLPTFGFYRFWLLTDARRYLWSRTRLGDDALEYNGQARQLLIGFLIAMAVLIPIYLGYFWLGIEAERKQQNASLLFTFAFWLLYHYASYRARRYRLSQTSFRGLRFSMEQAPWRYAINAIAWDMLVGMSLGFALPWREAALEHFRMSRTRYGDLQGGFAGTGRELFKRGWALWLAVPGTIVILFLLAMVAAMGNKDSGGIMLGVGLPLILFCLLIVFPLYKAVLLRWRLEGLRFGEVAFACDLQKRRVVVAYLKCLAAILVCGALFVLALGLVAVSVGLVIEKNASREAVVQLIVAMVPLYLLFLILCNMAMMRFIAYGVWAAGVASLTVLNPQALDVAAASGAAEDSLGEGIADAFDFGFGI
jgi:uncharacterized membrane protein YjgN (DUF898 family)